MEPVKNRKKERGDVIMVQGSHGLLQTLLAHALIDGFWLWIFSLVLWDGKRLFGDSTIPAALELMIAEISSTGVQILRDNRAGGLITARSCWTTWQSDKRYVHGQRNRRCSQSASDTIGGGDNEV